jgi:uncharacterized membrane protein YfhO
MGVIFLVIGFLLITTLEKWFKKYYKQVSCKLWISAIVLSISLILRGVLSMSSFFMNEGIRRVLNSSYQNNDWIAPTYDSLIFFFIDMVPIWA